MLWHLQSLNNTDVKSKVIWTLKEEEGKTHVTIEHVDLEVYKEGI